MLGEFEQFVLLAVLRAGREAYGIPVRDEIAYRAGRDVSLGTVYKTLLRLEEKGLVRSRTGDPTPQRGGRRKRYYALTAAGRAALRDSIASIRRMASGLDLGVEVP